MNESKHTPDQWANIVKFQSKNWPEDYEQENGNYQNRCIDCGELFIGNKYRAFCKECEIPSQRFWERVSKGEPPKDNKCAHAGCWANGEMVGFARCMVKEVFPLHAEVDRLTKENQSLRYQLNQK